ncbi:TPA_asm: G [Betula betacytorhabdovirus 2]|nr:TPA_asm: G [Betula betacytorhabdovirus 2]
MKIICIKSIFLLIVLLSISLERCNSATVIELKSDQTLHLSPLVKCYQHGTDITSVSKMCLEQCPRSEVKAEVRNMRVLDKVQPFNRIAIFICHSYEESWTFDENWLFSKTKNLQERKRVSINETECRRLLNEVCHGHPCKTSSVIENLDEYNYASSITKTISYSGGAAMNLTAIIVEKDEIFLNGLPGLSSEIKVNLGKAISQDTLSGYFWNPAEFLECPLRKWQVTQCLVQPSKSIVCSDIGLNVWDPKPVRVKHCDGREFYTDDKGILLEYAPGAEKLTRARYIEVDSQLTAKESNMVAMMNEALRVRDELTCDHQCLELSNVKHSEDTILSSSNSFWRYSMGQLFECVPLYGCDFAKGMTVCQDPLSISMNCLDEVVSWDPEKDYATFPAPCHAKRARVSEYKIRTKQGIVHFNQSGAYLQIPDDHLMHIKHLSSHISTLKLHSVQEYANVVNSHDSIINGNTDIKSVTKVSALKGILALPEYIVEWIEDAENDFKKMTSLFFGLALLVVIFLILRKRKHDYVSRSSTRSFNRIQKNTVDQVGEIYEI